MKISIKINLLIVLIVLIMSGTLLLVINVDLIKQNRIEIEKIQVQEYEKAQNILKNYIDIAYKILSKKINDSENIDFLKTKYGNELKNIIDSSETLIDRRISEYRLGQISLNEAKRIATSDIKTLRYANNTGYIWINDTGLPYPKMVMHPTVPSLDGTVLNDKKYNVALKSNKNLFQAAVEISLKDGEGFVDYMWPKPTPDGLSSDQPKLSYVRHIPEFNWVIGTGIYIDDAIRDAKEESLLIISSMRYDEGNGYFWINDKKEPIPNMVMHPISPNLDGKLLDNSAYNKVKGTEENLFSAMVSVVKDTGEGFVEYMWPKPLDDGSSSTKEEPKLSFVKSIDEWDWIIGTGFYIDDIDKRILEKSQNLQTRLRALNLLVLIIGISLGILLVVAGSIIVKAIVNPIKISSNMLEKMSHGEGDLTKRLSSKTTDEVGDLSNNFNHFIEKLIEIINEIKESIVKTVNIEEELGISTDNTSNEVTEINNKINNIKEKVASLNGSIIDTNHQVDSITEQISRLDANIEDESSALEQSAAAINEMVASIHSVSNITNKKNRSLEELLENTNKGGNHIDISTKAIEAVYGQLEEIKSVSTLISQISDETNLLAMNAAIEAANAGDAGRGFSVVAGEIRKLAESSAKSVKNITTLIKSVSDNIENSFSASNSVKNIFTIIDVGVKDVAVGLEEITRATDELSKGGNEILEAIDLLNSVSLEVQDGSSKMKEMSGNMNESMKSAQKISSDVTNNIDGVYKSAEKITNAIKDITTYNKALAQTSDQLSKEISQFKT